MVHGIEKAWDFDLCHLVGSLTGMLELTSGRLLSGSLFWRPEADGEPVFCGGETNAYSGIFRYVMTGRRLRERPGNLRAVLRTDRIIRTSTMPVE